MLCQNSGNNIQSRFLDLCWRHYSLHNAKQNFKRTSILGRHSYLPLTQTEDKMCISSDEEHLGEKV